MRLLLPKAMLAALLFMGCYEPSGGIREALPGLDGGTQLCGASVPCPEGELCHPSGVCIPCPGGSCGGQGDSGVQSDAVSVDAARPEPDAVVNDGATDAMMSPDMETADVGPDAASCIPDEEVCNGIDDDCDLRADETFDLLNDAENCGACGVNCQSEIPNAESTCASGVCTLVNCLPGFTDTDGDPGNGCEASMASLAIAAPEDGAVYREDFDIVLRLEGLDEAGHVEVTVNGQFLGRQAPAAMMTFPLRSVQFADGTLRIRAEAVNLNGAVMIDTVAEVLLDREAPSLQFLAPATGLRPGGDPFEVRLSVNDVDSETRVEIGANGDSVFVSTAPPFVVELDPRELGAGPVILTASARDRAGHLTEVERSLRLSFCQADDMVDVPDMDVRIDRYESSRPDATRDDPGTDSRKSCSQPGVAPWSAADYLDAEAACEASGKRLCSPSEWRQACGDIARTRFPYGDIFDRQACNGLDNEDAAGITPTGELPECVSSAGAFDLSGNLAEWTTEEAAAVGVNGGHYLQGTADMTCQSRLLISRVRRHPTQGFRCCLDAP